MREFLKIITDNFLLIVFVTLCAHALTWLIGHVVLGRL